MDFLFPSDLTSGIYLRGGFNNTMKNLKFENITNTFEIFIDIVSDKKFKDYFPESYFNHMQGSLIHVEHQPTIELSNTANFSMVTYLFNCTFSKNRNY